MTKVLSVMVVVMGVTFAASPAQAKRTSSRLGFGAEATLTGPRGAVFIYDKRSYHIDGIVGYRDTGNSELQVAGRFFWILDFRRRSDFGIGGGLGVLRVAAADGSGSVNDLYVEGGAQIRAFIVPNVALSMFLGLGIVIQGEENVADTLEIGAQLNGTAGIAYYF